MASAMSDYRVSGYVVERVVAPRLRVVFRRRGDGSGAWDSSHMEPVDPLPTDAALVARIMREAGDAFVAHLRARGEPGY